MSGLLIVGLGVVVVALILYGICFRIAMGGLPR